MRGLRLLHEEFKYRYLAADGVIHSFELSAPCHSGTPPLVAYAFAVGLIDAAEDLLDVLVTSEYDRISYEVDGDQASEVEDAHINRLAVICAAMEAKDLQDVTEAANQLRQEEALKRMSQEWVPLLKHVDPRSQWMGKEVYNAYPIHNHIRNINPTSLKTGVHVMENFAGVGLGVLRMTAGARLKVRVYTYIDRDPVSRKIARHVLLQLQLQHPNLILSSTI